ncbi:hypothetical protein IWZ03DRAFT_16588 [Phyllosticta citriasiana]|uniref:Uncharacterized protein n=1 Tax=Phyllosticta citriasiana TaxID=595635 RepID=A0ABR1KZC5_9PEZI
MKTGARTSWLHVVARATVSTALAVKRTKNSHGDERDMFTDCYCGVVSNPPTERSFHSFHGFSICVQTSASTLRVSERTLTEEIHKIDMYDAPLRRQEVGYSMGSWPFYGTTTTALTWEHYSRFDQTSSFEHATQSMPRNANVKHCAALMELPFTGTVQVHLWGAVSIGTDISAASSFGTDDGQTSTRNRPERKRLRLVGLFRGK